MQYVIKQFLHPIKTIFVNVSTVSDDKFIIKIRDVSDEVCSQGRRRWFNAVCIEPPSPPLRTNIIQVLSTQALVASQRRLLR